MIPILAQLAIAIIPLVIKLIDKLVPSKVTRKKEFKAKKKMMDGLDNFRSKKMAKLEERGHKNYAEG